MFNEILLKLFIIYYEIHNWFDIILLPNWYWRIIITDFKYFSYNNIITVDIIHVMYVRSVDNIE